jgi:hypothetical protein
MAAARVVEVQGMGLQQQQQQQQKAAWCTVQAAAPQAAA